MCGIAGYAGNGSETQLKALFEGIRHRGPDDEGFFVRDNVGLAHARLSIIDTSSGGHQPMFTQDGSTVIIFNGEIYNFQELRADLEAGGRTFRNSSDTEVILALYSKYGTDCFAKLSGMFAIAIYDFSRSELILVRDRIGEKPLYWTIQRQTLYFASEMRALLSSGVAKKEVDLFSLQQYLQFDYVPTPRSIISDVYKLEPGTMLVYRDGDVTKKRFWDPPQQISDLSFGEATSNLDSLLKETVARELVSDVPLGVFLSGGIDSSTIAYYAKMGATRTIDTFSIGFNDPAFDESRFAREVAGLLGTNHHEEVVRAEDALDLIPSIPEVLSEPVADASIIPTMLLSRFARKSVTVALGGDGGDELFAGYPTFRAEALFRYYKHLPSPLRALCTGVINTLPASHGNLSFSYNLKKFVSSDDPNTIHRHLEWLGTFDTTARAALLRNGSNVNVFADADRYAQEFTGDRDNALLYAYMRTYLMDQVLVKVDRASMHYALETRAPFLDHAVVDLVFSLPYDYKYRNGTTKYLLKELMHGKLPPHIISRKKKGFGIPLARWLAGPLHPLMEELLSPNALKVHGLFDGTYVKQLKDAHMNGARDNRKELWNLMVFQLWYDRWMR